MADIKISLTRLPVTDLWQLTTNVVVRMTNNPYYPSPVVPLPVLQQAADKLQDDLIRAIRGSEQDFLERNDTVRLVNAMLKQQADYVRAIAKGNPLVLASSGFNLRKERRPIGELEAPKGLIATMNMFRGCIDLRCKPVHGASTYQVWHCAGDTNEPSNWKLAGISTRARFTVRDLESARYHSFRMNAVGAAGASAMSSETSCLAA